MSDFLNIGNKVFLITGAGSGIGQAIAQLSYKHGAKVIILDKNQEGLEETAKDFVDNRFCSITADLTDFDKLEDIVKIGVDKVGKISGFCHSAGFEYTLPIKSMTAKHYQDLFNINTISCFELAKIISKKKYIDIAGASFVFIASIMGIVSRPGLAGYSASKGALIAGARSFAIELAKKNIRVNTVSPGTILTNLIEKAFQNMDPSQKEKRLIDYPFGFGKPEDIANAVMFLFSDSSRWITGTNIVIDGVYTAK